MLIPATQLRAGMLLEMDGALYRVMKMQHITPGNWRGMVQTTLRNLQSGSKLEKRFRSTDKVDRATVDAQDLEFLSADGDQYVFMHPTTYEQTTLTQDVVETEPAMRGATATASMKPATTETGLVVQVPQFVTEGEVVRVDTAEGKYIERVS